MVSLTGKSRVGSARASAGGAQSRPSVGGRNLKVFSEIDRTKVGDGNMTSAKGSGAGASARRITVVANKGVISTTSNPKGGLKKSMDKSSGKYGTSANTNVRKALADVSNVQEKFTTAVGHATSKMKVSAGSTSKIVGVSLRNSFKAHVFTQQGFVTFLYTRV